jgi:hypothetical protein
MLHTIQKQIKQKKLLPNRRRQEEALDQCGDFEIEQDFGNERRKKAWTIL